MSGRQSNQTYASVSTFEEFVEAFGRSYVSEDPEYAVRKHLFEQRLEAVQRQNSRPASERLWTAGITWMADYTKEEMDDLTGYYNEVGGHSSGSSMLSRDEEIRVISGSDSLARLEDVAPLPDTYIWDGLWTSREENVHLQTCGNCWAMSTTSMLEAHAEIHLNITRHFSFQEVTDCAPNPWKCGGLGKCQGSIPELGLLHVQLYGLWSKDLEHVECPSNMTPYWSEDEPAPHEQGVGVRMTEADSPARLLDFLGWERLAENKIDPLKRALVARGPATVGVSTDWSSYSHGIFDDCGKDAVLQHSMLLLGYGKEQRSDSGSVETKYWLLQNSWGHSWGERGQMRLLRLDDEEEEAYCGTDNRPSAGSGCEDGPKTVHVCGACGILYHTTVPFLEPRMATSKANLVKYLGSRALEQLGFA